MFNKLVDLLPDSVKNLSTTLISPPPPPRVPVLHSSFEYLPISAISPAADPKTAFQTNHLCLLICTPYAFEIWALADYKRFQRIYCRPENNLHMAHYIPLIPIYEKEAAGRRESVREYLNSSMPIVAISKQTEEYSSALGIHLLSLKSFKYFHVFRFTSELQDFVVSQHVIVANLKGGQIKIFDLKTLEQYTAIDTIFLSKEMHDLLTNEDVSAEIHIPMAREIKDMGTCCDITPHLIAYVRHDLVSPSKFGSIAKGIMDNQLIQEYSFAKEATKKLFSLGEAGYQKMMNIFNTRKAMAISKDSLENDVEPSPKIIKKSSKDKPAENESFAKEEEKYMEILGEVSEGEDQKIPDPAALEDDDGFVQIDSNTSNVTEKNNTAPMSMENENKLTVIIQRIVDNSIICKISPPYFKNVSLLKFSPSGMLLLLANENGQQFYIYKIYPDFNYRHLSENSVNYAKSASLLYTIFRGYTYATVSSVSFSLCERWLIINSSKGTSHIYRLDENLRDSNLAIINNTQNYDYSKKIHSQGGVISLSAFSRFKYNSSIAQNEIWPVTAILSNYPLERLGTKKEVLLRMGAIFYNTSKNMDETKIDIPLFVSITKRGEIFTNALLTFNSNENEKITGSDFDYHDLYSGQKEYDLLKEGKNKLPHKKNYYNDKLVVESLAQFELMLDQKDEKSKEYLDKNVVSVKKSRKTSDPLELESKIVKIEPEAIPIQPDKLIGDEKENIRKLQQKWLKSIETSHFSQGTPSIKICPQFVFCQYDSKIAGSAEESKIQLAKIDDIYEKLLTNEESYKTFEKRVASKVDLTAMLNETNLKTQSGKEGHKTIENDKEDQSPRNENPFYDMDSDKELEKRLEKALNSSISNTKVVAPEQKSQMFEGGLNLMEDYKPEKKNEESTIEKSEYS